MQQQQQQKELEAPTGGGTKQYENVAVWIHHESAVSQEKVDGWEKIVNNVVPPLQKNLQTLISLKGAVCRIYGDLLVEVEYNVFIGV